MVLNCTVHPFSNDDLSLQNEKWIFPPFGDDFLPSSENIILKGHQILYLLKQNDICDYNTIYLMSNSFMFDDTIMNIFRKKVLK